MAYEMPLPGASRTSPPPPMDAPPDDAGGCVCPKCGAKLKIESDEPEAPPDAMPA